MRDGFSDRQSGLCVPVSPARRMECVCQPGHPFFGPDVNPIKNAFPTLKAVLPNRAACG